jgi:hypothetical protein
MMDFTARNVSAIVLLIAFVFHFVTVFMWSGRNVLKWSVKLPTYLYWERGTMIAAFVIAAMGISLLENVLQDAGETILAPLGAVAFLIGAVVGIIVESSYLSSQNSIPALTVVMVVVLFVAQAILGGALIASSLLPAWIGWTLVVWNLGWLGLFSLVRPRDIYYPVLHFFPLLLIGIALFVVQ